MIPRLSMHQGGNCMKIEKSKDSMSRIINDYIDGAFPLPEHKGPKNISFGENKRVKDLVKSKVRAGMKDSDILHTEGKYKL